MTVRAICFDLDDTLFEYEEYARAGLRSAADRLEALTGDRYQEELEAMYFQEGITEGTFDQFLARYELPADLRADLIEAYHDASTQLSPYQETERVLSELQATYRTGLVTDGRGGHAKLRRLGIREYFDAVVVTPTIGTSKRETDPFEIVLSELSIPPEDAVYVGDDPRFDFRVPNELGMTTVRIRRGRQTDREPETELARPDHEITTLDHVTDCLSTAGQPQSTLNR